MTPVGWENPLRLGEDLATVDILSGGRLNPVVSMRPPMRWDDVKNAFIPTRQRWRTSPTNGSSGCWRWASEHGLNLLTSSVVKDEAPGDDHDFAAIQLSHVRALRAAHPAGGQARVSQGLVVIPTDSATPEQRTRCEAYAASRLPRTATPQGPARTMFAPDLVGTSAELAERLQAHAAYREVEEVAFALPFTFEHDDYVQILTDIATHLAPAPGWSPQA